MIKKQNIKLNRLMITAIVLTFLFSSISTSFFVTSSNSQLIPDPDDGEASDPNNKQYPPMLYDIPNYGIQPGQKTLIVDLNRYVSDFDDNDDTLVWEITGNNELTVNIESIETHPGFTQRYAVMTIPEDWKGQEILTFTVTDPDGLSDSDSAIYFTPEENEYLFSSFTTENIHVSALDDKHFVVAYTHLVGYPYTDFYGDPVNYWDVVDIWTGSGSSEPPSHTPLIRIGTVNDDGSITYSEQYKIVKSDESFYSTVNRGFYRVTALSSSKFVVFFGRYNDWEGEGGMVARVGTINSDGSVSFGDLFYVAGPGGGPTYDCDISLGDICTLDESHFVLTYNVEHHVTTVRDGEAFEYNRWVRYYTVGKVTGDTIERVAISKETIAQNKDSREPNYGGDSIGTAIAYLAGLDSTHFVIAYQKTMFPDLLNKYELYTQVYTFTGDSLTKGSPAEIDYCTIFQDIDALDSTHFIIGYNGFTRSATITGEEISYGEPAYCPVEALTALDSTHFAAIPSGYAQTGIISQEEIQLGISIIDFNCGITSLIDADNLNSKNFVVTYCDNGVGMSVVLPPLNYEPVANNDMYNMLENTMLYSEAPGLLLNDEDQDNDELSVEVEKLPVHGSLILNSDGSFYYTPETDYVGVDEFTYKVYDGKEYSEIATVRIIVSQQSDFNNNPNKPEQVQGPNSGQINNQYTYSVSTTDSDNDDVFYMFDWDDGTSSGWIGPYNSGDACTVSHIWSDNGVYDVNVKAKDSYGAESDWSETLEVTIGEKDTSKSKFLNFFMQFLQNHPNAFPLLKHLLNIS